MASRPAPLIPFRRAWTQPYNRPVTSDQNYDNHSTADLTPSTRSYHNLSDLEILNFRSSATSQGSRKGSHDEAISNDPFEAVITTHIRTTLPHARRPSHLAESLRSGVSGLRSLGRRVSLSVRGKNKPREDMTESSVSPRILRKQRSEMFGLAEVAIPTISEPTGSISSPNIQRRPSVPLLNTEPQVELVRPVLETKSSFHRAVTVVPDYLHGGAGARASAAAQNEALQLARSTPLPPYEASPYVPLELRDSESGIGIMLYGSTQQDSLTPHLARRDPVTILAVELVEHILSFLDAKSLVSLERTSRRWRELCHSQAVWREVFYQEYATVRPSRMIGGPSFAGLGKKTPGQDFRKLHEVRRLIDKRWANGEAAAIYLNGHKDSVYCIQFDEDKIITGSRDNTIRIWNARNYQCVKKLGPTNNPRERHLIPRAEVEPSGLVPFFKMDAELSEPQPEEASMWHQASVLCLQYDEEILVTGSSDFTCIVWSIKDDYKPLFRLIGHTAGVLDVCIDANWIVTCSKDTTIKVWDRATGKLLKTLAGHRGPVNAVQVRGNLLASASGDGMSKLWSLEEGVCIKEFRSKERGLACVEFSEDGRTIFSGGNDQVIYEYDTVTGNVRRELEGHKDLVRSLHLDTRNGRLISGSYDHSIKVWNSSKGVSTEDGGLELNLEGWTSSWMLAAKSNYRKIACASQDGRVVIVDFGYGIDGVELVEA